MSRDSEVRCGECSVRDLQREACDGVTAANEPHLDHGTSLQASRSNSLDAEPVVERRSFEDIRKRLMVDAEELALIIKKETEEIAQKIYEAGWRVVHHANLPEWMHDNDFLHAGHRPQLDSFRECFKSVFRVHTETVNIWTHLLGMVAFVGICIFFLSRPSEEVHWREKLVFSAFFIGAIVCLGLSWTFHTVCCHSRPIGKLFNKLDYCGITMLTVGSFVPWLYYSFYCHLYAKIGYLVAIMMLGTACLVVSLWEKFSEPKYRPVRAGMFVALGLSGIVPAIHFIITDGFWYAVNNASLGWLALMALLYIVGAVIYAVRIPERLLPGRFDIWFQSHQIFHILVVAAALVHYHGIMTIARFRLTAGDCLEVDLLGDPFTES